MNIAFLVRLAVLGSLTVLPAGGPQTVSNSAGKFDGNWTTHLSCEAHNESPAYKFVFPSTVKDGNFHGQHGEEGNAGYLVIDGKIAEDGSAKLAAKGLVSGPHGLISSMRGKNYSYNIKAQFTGDKGTGSRDEGAGILGRACTFEFDKQPDGSTPAAATPTDAPVTPVPAPSKPQ